MRPHIFTPSNNILLKTVVSISPCSPPPTTVYVSNSLLGAGNAFQQE